jgi:hypothetical protein
MRSEQLNPTLLGVMETRQSNLVRAAEQALEDEKARLAKERDTLADRIQTVDQELKRVLGGLAALRGDSKGRTRAEAGDMRPSLTDSDAARMVEEVLSGSAVPLDVAVIKARVLEICRERKVLGTGVHLVLQRVLADARFVQSKDGYALRGMKATG